MNKLSISILAIASVLTYSLAANADDQTHEGFQFRIASGISYLNDNESGAGQISDSIYGGGATVETYFGGAPIRGLFVGGMISDTGVYDPNIILGEKTYVSFQN